MDKRHHDRIHMSRMGCQEMLSPTPESEIALQKYQQYHSNDPPKRNLRPTNNRPSLSGNDPAPQSNHLTIPVPASLRESPSSQGSSAKSSAAPSSSSCSMSSSFTHYKKTTRMTDAQARLLNSPYLQPIISFKNPCLKNNQQLRNIYKSLLPMTNLHSKAINNAMNGNFLNQEHKLKANTREPKSATRKLPNISLCCEITLKFMGGHSTDRRHQVRIYQQRSGGTPVSVYTGCLEKGETFSFLSKRQHGFPFSITLYVNGMLIQRLSTCCEYKHRQNCKLGGSKGQFVLISVKGSFPCYRCQMADRQTSVTPPSTKTDDITTARTTSASSSEATNSGSQQESENGESDYEDDFDDGEDDQLLHDGLTEQTSENDKENAPETAISGSNESAKEGSTLEEPTELLHYEDTHVNETPMQASVNAELTDLDGVVGNENETIDPKVLSKDLEDPSSQSSYINDDEQNTLPIMTAIDQSLSSHTIDTNRAASTTSSTDDDQSSSNDDADTSITSHSDSNATDDEDVVCQTDYRTSTAEDKQCTHDPLGRGGEWMVHASPCCSKRDQKQWTSYRGHHQQFDSSDEEEANDIRISPRVTVTADVHASDFESSRTTRVSL